MGGSPSSETCGGRAGFTRAPGGGPSQGRGLEWCWVQVGPYPSGRWQRPTVLLQASETSASKPHRSRGRSELGCWGTQAHGFPVTPRGAKQWRQQGRWLPSPGRQLRGQAPSYREKEEGVSSPTTQAPSSQGPTASTWIRASSQWVTVCWTLSRALKVHQLPDVHGSPGRCAPTHSTDRRGH